MKKSSMKKVSNLNRDDYDSKLEKQVLLNLEKKMSKNQETNEKKEEIKFEEEFLELDDENINNQNSINNIESHFNISQSKLKDLAKGINLNKQKKNLFNEKIPNYQYHWEYNKDFHSIPRFLPKTSSLSKYLIAKENCLNLLIQDYDSMMTKSVMNLNFSENFNFRLFKYLDNYSDLFINSVDLVLRQNLMYIYLFHILNHMLKRKEEIEVDDKIERLIEKNKSKTFNKESHTPHHTYDENQLLQDSLFIDKDEEFLKNYFKKCELKMYAEGKGDLFQEYSVRNKLAKVHNSGQFIFEQSESEIIKDSGFTSPKVLILVPNKKHAKLIIEEIVNILRDGNWKGISNKKKFKEEFSEVESMNDCFRLGLTFEFFNNKLRLYQSFDSSDIVIASPLGLKLATSHNDPSVKNKKVYDFLSSIEILLIDFTEIFLYQNIQHLEEILSFINKIPKNNQNITNINRIKENIKDDNLKFMRQNIIISHFKNLEIELLVKKYCSNIVGGLYTITENYKNLIDELKEENIKNKINDDEDEEDDEDDHDDLINDNKNNLIKYEFKILRNADDMDIFDDKLNYFTKNLWQNLYDTFDRHTIIFVSSPLDYIRLKSYFKKNSVSVTFIAEDTDKKDWQRNRLFFEEGKYKFLLYSERAHYYKKINLKFAKNIFFYSLPDDPSIFKEMIDLIKPIHYRNSLEKYKIEDKNLMADNYSAVIALVSKIERYNLEKIIGTSQSNYIFKNKLDNYTC